MPVDGRPDVSIVTSGHDVADARLHREVRALQLRGLEVEVLGLGDAAAAPPGAAVQVWPRRSGLARAWYALSLPARARGRVLLTLDPDSAAGAWLVTRLLALVGRRTRFVADVHEDYALLLRDRAWATGVRGAAGAVWAGLGRFATRRADLVVVADAHLEPGLDRRVVLRNLADVSMLPGVGPVDDAPRALYVGDLRRSRGLFAMLDAVEAAPGWHLDLVGPVAAADRSELDERLRVVGLQGRVRWHDRLPPREAWSYARGAWVGLLLLEDTPAFRDAIPSKLYEYLACGLAVVTTDLPRAAELVRRTGAGVVVRGPADAAAVLRAWADDPAAAAVVRAASAAAGGSEAAPELEAFADAVAGTLTVRAANRP